MTLVGYATIWGSESTGLPHRERIMRGAFAATIASGASVRAHWRHAYSDPRTLASTDDGTLELEEDGLGLRFRLRTDGLNKAHIGMLENGLIGVSPSFLMRADSWATDGDFHGRTLLDADLREISLLPRSRAAYQQTFAHLEPIPPAARRRRMELEWARRAEGSRMTVGRPIGAGEGCSAVLQVAARTPAPPHNAHETKSVKVS